MTIVLTGGGSGGHITPILAVAHEIKQQNPDAHLVYIGQKGDGLTDIVEASEDIDEVRLISAGKLRRYHGEGLKQLLDVHTVALNVRDGFRVVKGLAASYKLLRQLKPDVVFVKGGFVGLPVGLAAAKLHIPLVTHDSDAIPGLTNRVISRWATVHAVALPADVYAYPQDKTVTVGVPVHSSFQPVDTEARVNARNDLGYGDYGKLLFVTGGGLGARRLNGAVATAVPDLLRKFPDLVIVQSVGRQNEAEANAYFDAQLEPAQRSRVDVKGYITDMYRYSAAADVVVTRAGATALAEFAVQHKPCVVVPNPFLTAGHQLKNADYLAEQGAAVVVHENELDTKLGTAIADLLADSAKQQQLGGKLATFAAPDAAKQLAMLLLKYQKPEA